MTPVVIRQELDTHFWGTLATIRAFAPILSGNGDPQRRLPDVLAVLTRSQLLRRGHAAEWSLTNGVRLESAAQRTLVSGLCLGSTDTDMMAGWDIPKNDPADVVRLALDGIEAGQAEVIADQDTADAKAALSLDPGIVDAGQLRP